MIADQADELMDDFPIIVFVALATAGILLFPILDVTDASFKSDWLTFFTAWAATTVVFVVIYLAWNATVQRRVDRELSRYRRATREDWGD